MIELDINVLVRYTMQDDPKQSRKATRLIESLGSDEPGFVPLVAVVEWVRVLSSGYERAEPARHPLGSAGRGRLHRRPAGRPW